MIQAFVWVRVTQKMKTEIPSIFVKVGELLPIEVCASIESMDSENIEDSTKISVLKVYLDDSDLEIPVWPLLSNETKLIIEAEVYRQAERDAVEASTCIEDLEDLEDSENERDLSQDDTRVGFFD